MNFTAIDFETANRYRNSACAVGLVRVQQGRIVLKESFLIRPPSAWFEFTHIHGITYDDVRHEPPFAELWPLIEDYFHETDFLVAHNAAFDRSVLRKTCEFYDMTTPDIEFKCTVKLARSELGIYPTKLSDVCRHLDIPLNHHDPLSDALACAKIMLHINNA